MFKAIITLEELAISAKGYMDMEKECMPPYTHQQESLSKRKERTRGIAKGLQDPKTNI